MNIQTQKLTVEEQQIEEWMSGKNVFELKKNEDKFILKYTPETKKQLEDKEKPKKYKSAYMTYKTANPNKKKSASDFKEDWNNLPKAERMIYEQKAKEDKKRYENAMKEYKRPSDEVLRKRNRRTTGNPGKLGEIFVQRKLRKLGVEAKREVKIPCDWMWDRRKTVKVDLDSKKAVFEVKTLRYYATGGKRGNQGTAPEKIDHILRRCSGIPSKCNKKVVVVLCGDMINNEYGQEFLDAFCRQEYHGNDFLRREERALRGQFFFISYDMLTCEFLEENDLV